jgi:hypothetical protein
LIANTVDVTVAAVNIDDFVESQQMSRNCRSPAEMANTPVAKGFERER